MIRIYKLKLGAIRSLLFVGLFAVALAATPAMPALAGNGNFSTTGSMNFARDGATATLLQNGDVLVVGGWNATNGSLVSAELYNPAKGKWTLTGSMTAPRQDQEAVLLPNGQVLVAGGYDPSICCQVSTLATA